MADPVVAPSTSTPTLDLTEYSRNKNVLHRFRSYVPFFRLSVVETEAFDSLVYDPARLETYARKYVIMQSGGKGTIGIDTTDINEKLASGTPSPLDDGSHGYEVRAEDGTLSPLRKNEYGDLYDPGPGNSSKIATLPLELRQSIAESFNEQSAGRFDFYFGAIDLNSIASFEQATGFSFGTKIEFEIFEPYSLGGLIEALHAYSIAAGYATFPDATFVLTVGFRGYPDNQDTTVDYIPNAVAIEPATRYYPFRIGNVEVASNSTEGTRYKVKGFPTQDLGLGQTSIITSTLTAKGSTVSSMLEDLMRSMERAQKEANRKIGADDYDYDEYEILFPAETESGSLDFVNAKNKVSVNKIYNSRLVESAVESVIKPTTSPVEAAANDKNKVPRIGKQNRVYNTGDSGEMQVSFSAGTNITEAIAAIVRDSEYSKNIFVNFKNARDANDLVDYFCIGLRVSKKGQSSATQYSTRLRRPLYRYTYYVIPHKVHYSRIPMWQDLNPDIKTLLPVVRRVYDYVYTGNSSDIITFNLNYNALYYQSLVDIRASLIKNYDGSIFVNPTTAKQLGEPLPPDEHAQNSKFGRPAIFVSPELAKTQGAGPRTRPPSDDPYANMVKALHHTIQQPVKSLTMDLEIVGDPFYLVQSGIGNIITKSDEGFPGITLTGDADFQKLPIMVQVNLKNAVDYDETGIMKFNGVASFSGVYMVNTIETKFPGDGTFKQRLKLLHLAFGQAEQDVNGKLTPSTGNPPVSNPDSEGGFRTETDPAYNSSEGE